jgi:hypothetical protein
MVAQQTHAQQLNLEQLLLQWQRSWEVSSWQPLLLLLPLLLELPRCHLQTPLLLDQHQPWHRHQGRKMRQMILHDWQLGDCWLQHFQEDHCKGRREDQCEHHAPDSLSD